MEATDVPGAARTALQLIAVLSVFGGLPAAADVADLQALKSVQRELTVRLDSLALQRGAIEAELDSLSTVIDSLKLSAPESEQVKEALLSSMTPVWRVTRIDYEMEEISARRDSVTDALRSAYDWEISTLLKNLWEELDEGLLQQLIIFQDERQALGDRISGSRMRYPEDMVVGDADGPDEIRQKIQLWEGKKGLLQAEVRRVEARIKQLEAERLLATRVWVRAEQRWTLERRTFRSRSSLEERAGPGEMSVVSETQSVPRIRAKGDPGVPVPNYIVLKIRTLHARREEFRQMVAVVEERVGAFRRHLRELLDGRE